MTRPKEEPHAASDGIPRYTLEVLLIGGLVTGASYRAAMEDRP